MNAKHILQVSVIFLFLAVLLGAFGAHGLEKILDSKHMQTFQTGIRYQFYHALSLLVLGALSLQKIEIKYSAVLFIFGIIFFSFNCYLYAVSNIKFIALLIPIGGISFVLGWLVLFFEIKKGIK